VSPDGFAILVMAITLNPADPSGTSATGC